MSGSRLTNRVRYFVSDAWEEWRHSPGVNLLAVATLAATLFIAGLALLVLTNLGHQLQLQREEIQIQVYLQDSAEPPAVDELRKRLELMPGVTRVALVDKAEAARRYAEWARERVELLQELETNPLPASLEVTLEPGPEAESRGEAVVAAVEGLESVEEVRFDRDWLRRLEALLDLARVGGSGLAVLVFAAVIVVMASVLQLAVYARRDEIEIMLLVGASPAFVRGPFLVAGLGQGLLASLLAVLLVEGSRQAALARAGSGSVALLELALGRPLPLASIGGIFLVGTLVSLIGAAVAVRSSLR